MNPPDASLDQAYFDQLYANDPDPWQFATSAYEAGKYAETLEVLPRERYGRALEVGCSIGELTFHLAGRVDALDAIDLAEAALAKAAVRNAPHSHVRFARMMFPAAAPEGPFDLIMLSEVLYFLSERDLLLAIERVKTAITPGGDVLLVNWLGETPGYPSDGDTAANRFMAAASPELSTVRQLRRERYRIDLLRRAP